MTDPLTSSQPTDLVLAINTLLTVLSWADNGSLSAAQAIELLRRLQWPASLSPSDWEILKGIFAVSGLNLHQREAQSSGYVAIAL